MTPHDDANLHDDDDLFDSEDVFSADDMDPMAPMFHIVGGLAFLSVLTFVGLALVGFWDFTSHPFGVLFGAALVAAAVFGPVSWTVGGLGVISCLSVTSLIAPDFGAGGWAGMATASTAVASMFAVVWLTCCVRYLRATSDPLKRESKVMFEELDELLAYSAAHLEPHTRAKLAEKREHPIVGLSGYAGAGKDTAALGLIYGLDYTRVSFADKIRESLLALNPWVPVDHPLLPNGHDFMRVSEFLMLCDGDWTVAKRNDEVRDLLQRMGTDAGRKVLGDNVWVDAVMRDLPAGPVVFTDCRFPNEAEAIKAAGGHVVRITRPGVDAVNAHVSETALDGYDFDAVLINDETPAIARERAVNIMETLRREG